MSRLLVALTIVWAASAQSPASTVVLGRVVEGLSDVPVADALIRFRGLADPYLKVSALTDARGNFAFFNVPPGQYELRASKSGYWFGEFGQQRPAGGGRAYVVTNGHRDGEIRVPVWRMAAVSGTVVDEAGEPVVGIAVQALPASPSGARMYIWNASPKMYRTDERGVYRIGDLNAGEYLLAVPPSEIATSAPRPAAAAASVGDLGYAPAFFPGGTRPATDSLLTLASGEERGGVDFKLQFVRTHHIAGRLAGSPNAKGIRVQLARADDAFLMDQVIAEDVARGDGAFRFEGVSPGDYVVKVFQPSVASTASPFVMAGSGPVTVRPQQQDTIGWWAATPVVVSDTSLDDVSVDLQPMRTISGDVVFNGSAPKPRTTELALYIMPTLPSGRRLDAPGRSDVDDLLHFRTMELPAGSYFVRPSVGVPTGWAIESIQLDGRDALDQPVTLRDRDVSGLVITRKDEQGSGDGFSNTRNRYVGVRTFVATK